MPDVGSVEAQLLPANGDAQPDSATRSLPRRALLPHVLIVCWVAYLAVMIWQHADHSVQPPVYDSLTYLEKASNFWRAVDEHRWGVAFRAEPAVRPHGTILMSYPFGFSPDYRGFHFRSAFLPILLMVIAVFIAAGAVRRASAWWVAVIALLFSSLPLFYQFDWLEETVGPVRWGLVDNFQAGVAAIAAAALLRSLASRSLAWLITAAALGCLSAFVKPSGVAVMGVLGLLWLGGVLFLWGRSATERDLRTGLKRYAVQSIAVFFTLYAVTLTLCFASGYFSSANFAEAKRALVIMKAILPIRWQDSLLLFHQSSGEAFAIWSVVIAALFIWQWRWIRTEGTPSVVPLIGIVATPIMWAAGAWYWLVVQQGGNQIRYFYPFLVIGAVCLVPAALSLQRQISDRARLVLIAIALVPAINIGLLLAAGDQPSLEWQKRSGVSVSVGAHKEEVSQAYAFINAIRQGRDKVRLYSFGNGVPPAVFENVGGYEARVRPDLPHFFAVLPQDWFRGWLVRKNELVPSDYVLIRKYGEEAAKKFPPGSHIGDFYWEAVAFETWLAQADESWGIERVSDSATLRLLKVVDHHAFDRAFDRFAGQHTWRPEFVKENEPSWFRADVVPVAARGGSVSDVDFGGVYLIRSLNVTRTANGLVAEVWWEERVHEDANAERFLFLHALDRAGNIVVNKQIPLFPYEPPDDQLRVRRDRVTFDFDATRDAPASLGFGVYQPKGGYLMTQNTHSDYGGRRVLIPISTLESTAALPGKAH